MVSIYNNRTLDASKDEIRVVSILPESKNGALQCRMKTVSLQDWTDNYSTFVVENGPISNHGECLDSWYRSWNQSQRLSSKDVPERVPKFPDKSAYRFKWGDFAALSYAWGNPSHPEIIEVNGTNIPVTRNLASALCALQKISMFDSDFMLWIDALCINQKNVPEVNSQVGKMREIYTLSWSVIGFLGVEEDGSWKAIKILNDLADSYGDPKKGMLLRDKLLEKPDLFEHGSWIALNKFSTRPYWDRLWIIQEVALGFRRTLMFCGDKSMDWERMCHGFDVLHQYLWQAKDFSISAERKMLNPADTRTWINPGPLHHIWKDLWDLSQPEKRSALGLSRLLEISNFSKSMNSRDKVYGLLGLIPTEFAKGITPDYDIEAREVFIRSAKAYIGAYQSLELLRDANIWGESGAPTWVPDWSWKGRLRDSRPSEKYIEGDMNPDTYFENPVITENLSQTEHAWYRTDRGLPFTPVRYDGDHLICQGIIFDEVDGLGAQFLNGKYFPETVLQSENEASPYKDSDDMVRELSIALHANASQSPSETISLLRLPKTVANGIPIFESLGWKRFVTEGKFYSRWETWLHANSTLRVCGRPLVEYFSEQIPADASIVDYWTSYQSWMRTTQGRRPATTAKGYFAWIPQYRDGVRENQTNRGDKLVIIPGCSTPIVLRPDEGHFRVVGEAYVHGFMHGEMLRQVEGRYRMEELSLC
jgi:hypothetical protein